MPLPRPRQRSGLNDITLLPQPNMFNPLQEHQRQQQLQPFGDATKRNSMNLLPRIMKQATDGQFPSMISGTPIHDTSQYFMNWIPCSASQSAQAVPHGLVVSQEQGQALRSLGLSSLQPDVSLYGTPVRRGSFSQNSYFQEMSGDSGNSLAKTGFNQPQKPTMQLPAFCNSVLGDQCSISQKQPYMPDGAFIYREGFQRRNPLAQVPYQDLNGGVQSENFEQESTVQRSASAQELDEMQQWAGLVGLRLGKPTQIGSSPGMVALDPVEQKILFSMKDNMWDTSCNKHTDIGAGCFGNTLEQPNHSNVFPYVQSGSYSALMQSAVAEASSNDTGLQEEWSGLSFQNTELSTENKPSNIVDSGKPQNYWADNNMQSASSFCSKPSPHFNGSNMAPSFPGYQQPGSHLSLEQREAIYPDSSHESIQQSPHNDSMWFESNLQQKSTVEESQQFQPLVQLENEWNGWIYEHSERNAQKPSIFAHCNGRQSCDKPKGRKVETLPPCGITTTPDTADNENIIQCLRAGEFNKDRYKGSDFDGLLWNTGGSCLDQPLSTSISGLDVRQSSAHTRARVTLETREEVPDNQKIDYVNLVDSCVKCNDNEIMAKNQQQLSNNTQISIHSCRGGDVIFENRQNCYKKENSPSESYNSISSQHTLTGCESRENLWSNATESWAVTRDNQNSPSQLSNGLGSHEQGFFAELKSTLYGSHSAIGMEKGHLTDFQGSVKASADMASRGNLGSTICSPQDGLDGFFGSGITAKTSQNMLELLQGQFREGSTVPVPEPDLRFSTHLLQLPNSNNISRNLLQVGNFPTAVTSATPYLRNQCQGLINSNAPEPYQSSHSTWPGTVSRPLPFNLTPRDTSQPLYAYSSDQPSEAVHDSQSSIVSGMPQRGGFSVRLPNNNVWTVLPNQPLSAVEPHKVPSTNLSNNREMNYLNLLKDGNEINGFGAYSLNSNDHDSEKEQSVNESTQEPADMCDPVAQKVDYVQGKETAASPSVTPLHRQYFEKLQPHANQYPAVSRKDFDAFGRPLHQVKASNLKTDISRGFSSRDARQGIRMAEQKALCQYAGRVGNFMDTKLNIGSRLKASFPFEDTRMQGLMLGARGDQAADASLEPVLRNQPSPENVKFGWNDSRSRSSNTQMASNQMESSNSQISEVVAPPWFKHYESFKNGQTLPMHDARLARFALEHEPCEKASENSHVRSSVEPITNASYVDRTCPSTAPVLVESEHLPAPYIMSSGVTDQILSVIRPKKRKSSTSFLPPWHKEVRHGSQTFQTISMEEQHWAQATNRLVEKVENRTNVIEVGFPMARAKRRLIMATHQMQQLLRAAPAVILSADAVTNRECVVYAVAKLALGDACSLASSSSSTGSALDTTLSENPNTSQTIDNAYLLKVVESFATRAKKLDGDFLRLDKAVSFLGLRLECQELEKYAILNRFAKFYVTAQADAAETPSWSSVRRPSLQRYVTVVPQPRTIPAHAQCFSL